MERLGDVTAKISEWAKRCAARAETPEFKANAAKLREGTDAEQIQIETDRKMRLLEIGIPRSLWGAVDKPDATDAVREVGVFLANDATFCVLAGPKGRGKTFALCWAAAAKDGRFVEAQDMVTAGTFDREFWDSLERAPLLGLDEIGAEHPNSAFEASLYQLLNKRHQHGRKTLIATNLDAGGFRQRYGSGGLDRLIDRIKTGMWVNLPGESLRRHWADREPGED